MSIPTPFTAVAAPEPWMAEGLCREVDADLFFPEWGNEFAAAVSPAPAQRICAQCPVTAECLEYALDRDERYGVWAGKTPRQLADIRKQRRNSHRKAQP